MRGRVFNRRRALLEKLPDLLAQFRRVFVMVYGNGMLYRGIQKFLVGVCGQSHRAVHVAGKFATVDIFAGHDPDLLDRSKKWITDCVGVAQAGVQLHCTMSL